MTNVLGSPRGIEHQQPNGGNSHSSGGFLWSGITHLVMQDFTVPPPVERGDSVAIVAPASNSADEFPHVYELGLQRIRDTFDLNPVEYPTATKSAEWLADNPEARAQDVMEAFRDPEIAAVIANTGGNDQVRILEHLDADVLRDNPTRFFGWSDNTQLALTLWNQGVVSYYGGSTLLEYAMDDEMFEYTVEYLERALFEDSIGELREAGEFTDETGNWGDPGSLEIPRETEPNPGWTWAGGESTVSGRIWGGCLEVFVDRFLSDVALPDPDVLDGTILAIETSELIPHPDAVASSLQALGERGVLGRFDGVLVGRPAARSHEEMYDNPPSWREQYRERQRAAIERIVTRYNPDAPIVFDLDFGHTYPTAPIPIGGRVEIDPGRERIAFQ